MRVASAGHAVFAATLVALGIMGIVTGEFTVIWEPVPKDVVAREVLAYLCASLSMVAGFGLLWRRTATAASRVLLGYLLLWLLVFRVPGLLHSLGVDVYWSACRTAVIVAAAWVQYAWFAARGDRRQPGFAAGHHGLRIARTLYGLAIIPFGIAHFQYARQTAAQVPGWLPAHMAWVYFTGGAFIVAGLAVVVGVYARLAVALSALQMGLFLLLVWVPVIRAGAMSRFQRGEAIVTWVLAAAAWVVADSYRRLPGKIS